MSGTIFGSRAPTSVVVISLFVWITGVMGMIRIGQALLSLAGNPEAITTPGGPSVFFLSLSIAFVVNLIIISLSSALTRGSNGARILISISLAIHLILSILTILSANGDGITLAAGWIAVFLNVAGLGALLVTNRDFFRK
ncbi:hypothetical protein IWX81_002937 [Salinibacterium sp. CAN_S4]|uniref:hypothetical protein n=1 Tax=Salinibacterium sp. CAN_S4 TaxID=2787727 RepID=UPI0018EF97CC